MTVTADTCDLERKQGDNTFTIDFLGCCGGHCADQSEEATWDNLSLRVTRSALARPQWRAEWRAQCRHLARASSSTGWSRDLEVPRG